MRAPDLAWVKKERWHALTKNQKKSFAYLAPDFVLELQSDTDSLSELKMKMEKWIQNGVRLAWLISPATQKTCVCSPGQALVVKYFTEKLLGKKVL